MFQFKGKVSRLNFFKCSISIPKYKYTGEGEDMKILITISETDCKTDHKKIPDIIGSM